MTHLRVQRGSTGAMALCVLGGLLSPSLSQGQADPLLPDIIVRRSDLFDREIATDVIPGRRHLKLSNGTPNVGDGTLYLYGILPPNTDGTQDILQRIFNSDGTFTDRPAGKFVFHPGHDHIHVADWCQYRVREVLPEDGVGPVVREGAKVSFCILDLAVHDARLPNFRRTPRFGSCGATVQGLSVGWADIYHKDLPGQSIDITGVPDGIYWLESEVDPENHILELDEENNATRIKITIGTPPSAPDLYEPNDGELDLAERPPGGPNSPNLGPSNPKRVLRNLNVHSSGNDDYFKFYVPAPGDELSLVRIDFSHSAGNLQLALLDEDLAQLRVSTGNTDTETISLEGMGEGTYYARVFGNLGAVNPGYMLTVVPPRNGSPTVSVLQPGAGDRKLIHGADAFAVDWVHSDPEGNDSWVTVHLDSNRTLDEDEILVATSLHTPAELGLAVINSAEVPPGTYWVHCSITDGGSTSGSWSAGTVTFVEMDAECRSELEPDTDCNGNFVLDACEIDLQVRPDCNANDFPDECDIASGRSLDTNANQVPDDCERPLFHRGDANHDGNVNIADPLFIFSFLFLGGEPPACAEAASISNGIRIDISDGIFLLGFLFLGEAPPPSPGPSPLPCGTDTDPAGSTADLGCDLYERC